MKIHFGSQKLFRPLQSGQKKPVHVYNIDIDSGVGGGSLELIRRMLVQITAGLVELLTNQKKSYENVLVIYTTTTKMHYVEC